MRHKIILARDPKKFKHDFDLILRKPGFQEDIMVIRKKWKVDLTKEQLVEGNDQDLLDLLKKYKISKNWKYTISGYVLRDKFFSIGDPGGLEIFVSHNKGYGLVKIKPETRLQDLKKVFTHIKNKLSRIDKTRNRVPKNHNEDLLVNDLKREGRSYKEIKNTLAQNLLKTDNEWNLSRRNNKLKKRIDATK